MTQDLAALAAALRTQRQIDMDGCEVAVSRQACDEAADALEAQAASRAIRAAVPTPADAQAALDARINAAREEGRFAGLREAAKIAQSLHDRAATKGQVLNRNTVGKAILAKIKETEK